MKLVNLFTLILLLTGIVKINGQMHKVFTELLQKYVADGLVNYKGLKQDQNFEAYLNQMTKTDPSKLSEKEELAFWINAYNAFTLKIAIENYPLKSIQEIKLGEKSVWDGEFISINKKKYSLNDIEHKILRVKFKEPRIHFAIVCASISCPPLRNEAYEVNKLNNQLQEQAIEFLRDDERNSFDIKNKRADISKIFDWFGEDFGKSGKEILKYISKFLPEDVQKDIGQNINKWTISYKKYDWNLNEIK